MSYLVPIKAALIIFPFLALLITLPYKIKEYIIKVLNLFTDP